MESANPRGATPWPCSPAITAARAPTTDAATPEAGSKTPQQLWGDGYGRVGIRAAQTLLILAVSVVAVFALLQVKLLVIPMLIALILAAAISPFVNILKRRGINDALATVIAFVVAPGRPGRGFHRYLLLGPEPVG